MDQRHDRHALLHHTTGETLEAYILLRRAAERARIAGAPFETITALDVARANAASAYTAISNAEAQAKRSNHPTANDEATTSPATKHQVASKEHQA